MPLGQPSRDYPELLTETAKLLGELGLRIRLRHSAGESSVENVEVPRKREFLGRAIEKALEKPDLVGFGPYPMKLKGRRGGFLAVTSAVHGGRGGIGGRGCERVGWRFAFDGELGS